MLHKTLDPELTARHNDGKDHYNYRHEAPPEGSDLVLTGDHAGLIRLNDGTVYDVTEEVIEVKKGHGKALLHHFHEMDRAAGRTTLENPYVDATAG